MTLRNMQKPDQLLQLERIIRSRIVRATQALNKELESLHKIERELEERQSKVDALDSDMRSLQLFLSGDKAIASSVNAVDYKRGLERRYWIDYDRQREVYYLELTHEERKEQLQKVNEARLRFRSLECKHDILHKRLLKSRRLRESSKTLQQDAEIQDSKLHHSVATG